MRCTAMWRIVGGGRPRCCAGAAALLGVAYAARVRQLQFARYLLALTRLPPRVAAFMWRARRRAVHSDDRFTLASAIRPVEVAVLLRVARGRRSVVELGTGTAW